MQDAPSDPLFIPLQDSPEGAVRQAHSFSTERQSAKTPLVGETLVCDLLCCVASLFASALLCLQLSSPTCLSQAPLRRAKKGLVPTSFLPSLLHSSASLCLHLPDFCT